jgi:hypothetical protein
MPKGIFPRLPRYQQREKELEALAKVWERITPRARAIILITAGVWDAPRPYARKTRSKRTRKGETPPWLLPAINLLRDTGGQLSDREIARRIGVAHSSLVRNETYLRAREGDLKVAKPKKVVTRDPRVLEKQNLHR